MANFNIFIFRFERLFEGPGRLPKTRWAAQEGPRGGLRKPDQVPWGPFWEVGSGKPAPRCVMGGDALSLFVDAGLGMKFRRCFWEAFVALAWAGLAGWPGALALWLSRLLLGHE